MSSSSCASKSLDPRAGTRGHRRGLLFASSLAACLLLASVASSRESIEVLTAQITGPKVGSPPLFAGRLEFGPTFSVVLPAADASRAEPGLSAGVTATWMASPHVGAGLDFAYRYWPASNDFKAQFNRQLRAQTLNTLELGGTTWRINAIQMTAHAKFVAPPFAGIKPWGRIGTGLYRMDPNTTGYSGDAGFFSITARPLETSIHPGVYAAAGFDLSSGSSVRLGLGVSYDRVWCKEMFGSDFGAFAIGGHVLFGG